MCECVNVYHSDREPKPRRFIWEERQEQVPQTRDLNMCTVLLWKQQHDVKKDPQMSHWSLYEDTYTKKKKRDEHVSQTRDLNMCTVLLWKRQHDITTVTGLFCKRAL